MGMRPLSMVPGLVPERPFTLRGARSEARRRSMVAADMVHSCSRW